MKVFPVAIGQDIRVGGYTFTVTAMPDSGHDGVDMRLTAHDFPGYEQVALMSDASLDGEIENERVVRRRDPYLRPVQLTGLWSGCDTQLFMYDDKACRYMGGWYTGSELFIDDYDAAPAYQIGMRALSTVMLRLSNGLDVPGLDVDQMAPLLRLFQYRADVELTDADVTAALDSARLYGESLVKVAAAVVIAWPSRSVSKQARFMASLMR